MDGNFELGKAGWYSVQAFQLNDFLNDKLESDQYGLWYSVQFSGDADTYLWQTKSQPIIGEKYWGWLEKTRSGKATKFKWGKQNAPSNLPSGEPSSQTKTEDRRGEGITASMAVKLAYHAFIQTETMLPRDESHWADVKEQARQIYFAVEEIKASGQAEVPTPTVSGKEKEASAADTPSLKDRVKKWERDPPSRELSPDEANELLDGLADDEG